MRLRLFLFVFILVFSAGEARAGFCGTVAARARGILYEKYTVLDWQRTKKLSDGSGSAIGATEVLMTPVAQDKLAQTLTDTAGVLGWSVMGPFLFSHSRFEQAWERDAVRRWGNHLEWIYPEGVRVYDNATGQVKFYPSEASP